MTPTNEAGHGLPEVAAAREVIRAYFAGELDDTMILNLSESLALSRGVPNVDLEQFRDVVNHYLSYYRGSLRLAEDSLSPITCGANDLFQRRIDKATRLIALIDAGAAAAPAAAGAQGDCDTSRPGMSYWAVQLPGKMPKLYGAYAFAELNWYPDEGGALVRLQEVERIGDSITPQPAAADGGVRERALGLLAAECGVSPEMVNEYQDRDVIVRLALRAIEKALTQQPALSSHRQAGDGT